MSFTYDDFRDNADLRVAWARILASDVGILVVKVLRQRYQPHDVPAGLDALASARLLSQYHGAHLCLDDLENLTMAPGLSERDLAQTYNAPETDHERMPSPEETRGVIRVSPTPLPPE